METGSNIRISRQQPLFVNANSPNIIISWQLMVSTMHMDPSQPSIKAADRLFTSMRPMQNLLHSGDPHLCLLHFNLLSYTDRHSDCLHLTPFLTSSSVKPTLCMSSFSKSVNSLWGLPVFLRFKSSQPLQLFLKRWTWAVPVMYSLLIRPSWWLPVKIWTPLTSCLFVSDTVSIPTS